MDNRNWLHPFDAEGKRHVYGRLPKSIEKMADDPYRSLAGALRVVGGYAKDPTPYSEFLWADFLRRRIDRKAVEEGFEAALVCARELAHTLHASYLPGWCGSGD